MSEKIGDRRGLEVVQLGTADYDSLAELWKVTSLSSVRPSGRDSSDGFREQLQCGQVALGLKIGDALIASVIVTYDCRKGWINHLVVHPQHRRRGYGALLLEEAENLIREKGFRVVAALVEAPNEASLALFEKSGYAIHRDICYVSKRDDPDV